MQRLNIRNFKTGTTISLIVSVALIAASYIIGKQDFFLWLNNDGGHFSDVFFETFTYGGDGLAWIPVLLITIFLLRRKDTIPLLISAFIISTVIAQLLKNYVAENALRPIKAIADTTLIHTVPGVEMHTVSSFPSGHTATAFSIYLLFCLLLNNKWWIGIGLIYALLVGYSRIYLAQHFPVDVGAGIIVAVVSVRLSIKLQQYWWKRKLK